MNTRMDSTRRHAGRRLSGMLWVALAVCVLACGFCQISMLARISSQSKEISRVNRQIRDLQASQEDLQVCLSMYQSLDRIEKRAYAMGMQFPDETQIRVLSLPGIAQDGITQTVEYTAAETSRR